MQRLLITLMFSAFLLSCGSSGNGNGGGGTAQVTPVGGVVVAPSGILAKVGPPSVFRWFASLFGLPDEAVALVQSLSPVQNARVFLINVDNTGKPIGAPLAVSTTDAKGFFVFNLPKGTNLSPTASTLTVIQAAMGSASAPVTIGTAGVLNVPAVQSLMLVDPAGELGTRRIIAAGVHKFSTAAAAGYVGLIQALLDHEPGLVGTSVANTINNITTHFAFQNDVLPALADIEQSAQVDQSLVAGTYNLFSYNTYADSTATPLHRTTEHGDITFDPVTGTVIVNSNEFGGTLKETCTTICTRTFTLQFFQDQTFGAEGLFFRTATNRVIFSAPGTLSFAGHANPTGTVGIVASKSSDGKQGLSILVKKGTNISGADFAATFNFVNFGSILNQSAVNQPTVLSNHWPGILQSRTAVGTVTFDGSNSPASTSGFAGTDKTMTHAVSCNSVANGCALNSTTLFSDTGILKVALPFTILPTGDLVLSGIGAGGMSSDRALYAATQTDTLNPSENSFSVVVKQSSGMTNANLAGTYRVITLDENLMPAAQMSTRLVTGTAQFDGTNSSAFNTLTAQVDRTEGCSAGACNIGTTTTGVSAPVSDTRTYSVTTTGILTFSGGNIPQGATVNGGVSPDASFFVVQMRVDNATGTSTRSITLGVKTP